MQLRLLAALFVVLANAVMAGSSRMTVIISDTHFGVGRTADGWHAWEDFRWQKEFGAFLAHAGRSGTVDLVLNGDTFELWQTLGAPCATKEPDVGCTEKEILERLRRVLSAHKAEIRMLKKFAATGTNRIYVVPGNHDVGLLFPKVSAEIVKRLGSRVTVVRSGTWRSEDGRLVAVHGHQIDEANSFPDWPKPFTATARLHRPWGEYFVQRFYNDVEVQYPIIDNISREADALLWGFVAEGVRGSIRSGRRFSVFLLRESSWYLSGTTAAGLTGRTATGKGARWDLAAIRHRGPKFLIDLIPDRHPAHAALVHAEKAGLLREAFDSLADEDILAICDERAAAHAHNSQIIPCPDVMAGGALRGAFDFNDSRLRRYLMTLSRNPKMPDFDVAIFSHTHTPEIREIDFDHRPSVTFVNTGAWQRIVTAGKLDEERQRRRISHANLLKQMKITDLPACYPFVLIPPYTTGPAPRVKYWRSVKGGQWTDEEGCD